MPGPPDPRIREEAIAWHVRLQGGDAVQWAEFTEWLESDPRHNAAYEVVTDEDAALEAALMHREPASQAFNEKHMGATEKPGRSLWRWSAIAAAIVFVAMLAVFVSGGFLKRYDVATKPGETRVVALKDGGNVTLNGGTRITLDPNNPRFAELHSGEARFEIRHYADDPFTLVAGSQRVVDVGTVFNIVFEKNALTLDVAEGVVRYEGYGLSYEIDAGSTLAATPDGKIERSEKPPTIIASWTRGELVYQDAELAKIARDLQRASGVSIDVSPDIGGRRFSGVIQTTGSRAELRKRLEILLGVRVMKSTDGWLLEP